MLDSRFCEATLIDSRVSSIPFVVAVGACGTVSRILDSWSGWPSIRDGDAVSVVLEANREEGLEALRTALRPEPCQYRHWAGINALTMPGAELSQYHL